MAGFTPKRLYRGCHHLSSSEVTTCTDADTYYKIGGSWSDGNGSNNGFVFDGSGKITYVGESGSFMLFNGTSDLKANKVCQVTYALYKNGSLLDNNETPTSFAHANAIRNISLSNIIPVNKGDYFEIYVKSDTASTDVTSNSLMLTFLGD